MQDSHPDAGKTAVKIERTCTKPQVSTGQDPIPRKHISMHEDVPVWYDCCSCEAEPYWAELAEEPDAESVDARGKPAHTDKKSGRSG